jgi:hypothetical protein
MDQLSRSGPMRKYRSIILYKPIYEFLKFVFKSRFTYHINNVLIYGFIRMQVSE